MSNLNLVVTGIGMVTSVGNSWEESCAAQRAGINLFTEYDDFFPQNEELDFSDPEPLIGARSPYVNTEMENHRVPGLVLPVLQELIDTSKLDRDVFDELDMLVTVPSNERSEIEVDVTAKYVNVLAGFSKNAKGKRELVRAQHTGFVHLLSHFNDKVLEEGRKGCVFVTIDSYHHPETLEFLDENKKIKSKRSKDGFIPGEAAVAILVETELSAVERGAKVYAKISSLSHGLEEVSETDEKPSSGNGLTTVIRQACACANNLKAEWVICDLNGERSRSYDWGMARVKASSELEKLKELWHPADCFGDVGAASGGAMLGIALMAFEKEYAPADHVLVLCSDDDGKRAAFVVESAC